MQLREQRIEIEAAMCGRVRCQPPDRFRQLTFRSDLTTASGLVPRDRDVHEPLEEVALVLRRRTPRVLELLVRGEVLAGTDELYTFLEEATRRFRREGGRVLLVRLANPGLWVRIHASYPHRSTRRGFECLRLRPGRRRCGAGSRGRTRSGRCARRTANRARGR